MRTRPADPATASQVLQGITRAALQTESAPYQEDRVTLGILDVTGFIGLLDWRPASCDDVYPRYRLRQRDIFVFIKAAEKDDHIGALTSQIRHHLPGHGLEVGVEGDTRIQQRRVNFRSNYEYIYRNVGVPQKFQ